ncbi:MAG: hypothetical protein J5802_01135 [Butyrivibrio sp.]|nr:hypothetical protein [Butyrivibrio sp.]
MRRNKIPLILDILTIGKLRNKLSTKAILQHRDENAAFFHMHPKFYVQGEYIENQPEWQSVKYGRRKSSMQYSGCEILAVANALNSLGAALSADGLADLIKHFEEDGMCMDGNIGTSPIALREYLESRGYSTEYSFTKDVQKIDDMGRRYDTLIVFAYNNKYDIGAMIHTVCITKDAGGGFVIHNASRKTADGKYRASKSYPSLSDAICDIGRNQKSRSIMFMGIKKV